MDEATSMTGATPTGFRKRLSGTLLGAFICVELVYLPLANVLKLFPLDKPVSRSELFDDPQLRTSQKNEWMAPLEMLATACDR
jgi:hypothetical protein